MTTPSFPTAPPPPSTPPGAIAKPKPIPKPAPPPPPTLNIVDVGALLQASAAALNKSASSAREQQAMVAGENTIIPIVYGRRRVGPAIAGAMQYGGNLVLLCIWCLGEVNAVESIQINDAAVPGNVTVTHYTGAPGQTPDPTLVAACANQSPPIAFTDAMPGICYSVLVIPPGANGGFPRPAAVIQGLKVRSSQFSARAYSDNPAYILADFIESTDYGAGRTVDWATVATVAAACDTLVGSPSEKKRTLSLVLDQAQDVESWINTLRDYAGCFAVPEGGSYRLVLDDLAAAGTAKNITAITKANPVQITATAHGFATGQIVQIAGVGGMTQINGQSGVITVVDANNLRMPAINSTAYTTYTSGGTATPVATSSKSFDTSNVVEKTLKLKKLSPRNLPTVVEIRYTDTSQSPWRDAPATVYANGVLAGTTPRRMSRISRPGTSRYSEAYRAAVERLNNGILNDLTVSFQTFDAGLAVQVGDLIDVTHPKGITGKLFQVNRVDPVAAGRWAISGVEWDPMRFSTTVVAGPGGIDTTLPSPASPPAVTGLSVVEEVYQAQTGYFASRLRVTWNNLEATYPFVDSYEVRITQGSTLQEGPSQVLKGTQAYVTAALPENQLYTVTVAIVSTIGVKGTAATFTITNSGKLAKPSDVPSISGFEVGGEVRLNWTPATDLDLTGHEIRYSTTGGSWATATLLDRIATPAVRYNTRVVPAGTWRFWIKGLDSVRTGTYPYGQESVNAAYVDIVVTVDSNAFVAADYSFTTPTLVNMSAHVDGSGNTFWVTDMAETWNSLFTTTMSTYGNPLFTYHAAGNSGQLTEVKDYGLSLTGDWASSQTAQALTGAANLQTYLTATSPSSTVNVTGATNATPIVITTGSAHGYATGDEVEIASVGGNTNANGFRRVTVLTTTTFSLQDVFGNNVAGNAAYTSGGTSRKWTWSTVTPNLTSKTAARYGRLTNGTTGTGTLLVTNLGNLRCNVVARREAYTITTAASGPSTVVLTQPYTKAKAITFAIATVGAYTWAYDLVEVSGGLGIQSGRVLRFFGSGTVRVDCGDQAVHTFGNGTTDSPFSIEAWVKCSALGAVQTIVSKGDGGGGGEWNLRIAANGRPRFLLCDQSVPAILAIEADYLIPVDVWVHIAGTYSGSGTNAGMKIYVNGVLQNQTSVNTGVYVAMENTTVPMLIGNQYFGATYNAPFAGCIDEVRLWSTERTATEISTNKNIEVASNATGLVGQWKMNDGSGTTATDSNANAKHGTLTAGTGTLPAWRPYDGFDLYAYTVAATPAQASVNGTGSFEGI